MATITVTLPEGTTACNGKQVTFKAPCDCTGVTGIVIDGTTYALVDAVGTSVNNIGVAFINSSMVSVILDTENSKAYIQNPAVKLPFANLLSGETEYDPEDELEVLSITTESDPVTGSIINFIVPCDHIGRLYINSVRYTEANVFNFSEGDSVSLLVDCDNEKVFWLDQTNILPISLGGTGATTAADARTKLGITPANIGAAASDHTHDSLVDAMNKSTKVGIRYSGNDVTSANYFAVFSTDEEGYYATVTPMPKESVLSNIGAAPASHTQAADTITAGILGGKVQANYTAQETLNSAMLRNIVASTSDLTAGSSSLVTGNLYFVYE